MGKRFDRFLQFLGECFELIFGSCARPGVIHIIIVAPFMAAHWLYRKIRKKDEENHHVKESVC